MDRFKRIQDTTTSSVKASGVQSLTGTSGFDSLQTDKNNIHAKKTYKVLLRIQPPYIYKVKNSEYTGIMYDAWKDVKTQMTGYTFDEKYVETNNNFEFIKMINDENYDLGIGAVAADLNRIKEISFTTPIFINKCVIMFKDKHVYLTIILKFFFLYFVPFFIVLLLLSILLGYVITKHASSKNGASIQHTIALTASALFHSPLDFGSKSMLFQNVSFTTKTVFIILIIFLVPTFSLQLLQGTITRILIEAGAESEITRDTIENTKLIGVKGSNVPEIIETNYKCKMEYFDGDLEKTIQYYIQNTNTFDGVVANSAEAIFYASKYGLKITNHFFSLNQHGWLINFNSSELLQPIDEAIRKIMDTGEMDKLCKAYLGSSESYMCLF